ncbi:hypothetical protein D9756_004426 [Leucocoprinus leucothites]|uniref:Uncharacterized protein n=1 Tax=Leucocoprinus leucothites TaxID=201217 RepID=A0A8H5G8I8_9AGAR|nr:hypothetical protein D9756_004426 [Leucoagaricus leucothites]
MTRVFADSFSISAPSTRIAMMIVKQNLFTEELESGTFYQRRTQLAIERLERDRRYYSDGQRAEPTAPKHLQPECDTERKSTLTELHHCLSLQGSHTDLQNACTQLSLCSFCSIFSQKPQHSSHLAPQIALLPRLRNRAGPSNSLDIYLSPSYMHSRVPFVSDPLAFPLSVSHIPSSSTHISTLAFVHSLSNAGAPISNTGLPLLHSSSNLFGTRCESEVDGASRTGGFTHFVYDPSFISIQTSFLVFISSTCCGKFTKAFEDLTSKNLRIDEPNINSSTSGKTVLADMSHPSYTFYEQPMSKAN